MGHHLAPILHVSRLVHQTEPKGCLNQGSSELLYFVHEFTCASCSSLLCLYANLEIASTMHGATVRNQFLPSSCSDGLSMMTVLCPPSPVCQVFFLEQIVLKFGRWWSQSLMHSRKRLDACSNQTRSTFRTRACKTSRKNQCKTRRRPANSVRELSITAYLPIAKIERPH